MDTSPDRSPTGKDREQVFAEGRRMGLRWRSPFWDADVVDFLVRIPLHLRNGNGQNKGLLRKYLHPRFPHLGFDRQEKVLATDFFRTTTLAEAKQVWKTTEGVKGLAQLGIVDAAIASQKMSEALEAQRSQHANRIWHMLSLEAWVWSRLERR
jgi:asparagine synthetase B (glutamine-hydrolysing)